MQQLKLNCSKSKSFLKVVRNYLKWVEQLKKHTKNIIATWDAPAEVTQRVLVLGLEIFLNVNLVDFNQVQQPHFCKEIFLIII